MINKIGLLRRTGGCKSTQNMVILGENLATLSALRAGFGLSGRQVQVNLIYIDPPYNVGGTTGYKNEFRGKSETGRDWAGDHGAFLDFMEPRLKIGRQLLTDDGIICVSICDGEYARLKILMDEIFGPSNCLGTLIWNKNQGSAATHITAVHEYILVYAREKSKAPPLMKKKAGSQILLDKAAELLRNKIPYTKAQNDFREFVRTQLQQGTISTGESPYCLLDSKTFRPFQATPSCAQDKPESRCHKRIIHPITKKKCRVPAKGWKWKEETLDKMCQYSTKDITVGDGYVIAGQLVYGADENTVPRKLQYLDEKTEQVFPSVVNVSYGGQRDLPDGIEFSTPKPVALVKELVKAYPNRNAVILDYFAGSGATAQAVHELNEDDGGNRNWIMVEEMGTTYEKVLIPRLDKTAGGFATFELETIGVGG